MLPLPLSKADVGMGIPKDAQTCSQPAVYTQEVGQGETGQGSRQGAQAGRRKLHVTAAHSPCMMVLDAC